MSRDVADTEAWLGALVRRMERLESGALLENSSITGGRMRFIGGLLRVDSGGRVEIVGTLEIDGTTTVTGTFRLTGNGWQISGDGTISGNVTISGTLNVTGATTLAGPVTLNNDLTLGSSGQITAGTVKINRFGSYGGQVVSTGTVLYLGAGQTVIVGAEYLSTNKISATDIEGFSLDIFGPKNFKILHPAKAGHWLRHGSTESPVSGIEYWGDATLGADGTTRVDLPEYFESLAKPGGRTVFVTGRGHSPDWSDIDMGSFTVTGTPGGRFSWLVKAERFGGDFLLEEAFTEPLVSEWTPPSNDEEGEAI